MTNRKIKNIGIKLAEIVGTGSTSELMSLMIAFDEESKLIGGGRLEELGDVLLSSVGDSMRKDSLTKKTEGGS